MHEISSVFSIILRREIKRIQFWIAKHFFKVFLLMTSSKNWPKYACCWIANKVTFRISISSKIIVFGKISGLEILELYYFLDKIAKFIFTPNLKWKKLSNNSSWDFEHVLDTMDDYWVGPDENFCPESTPTRWRCYHFSKKWSKSKFDAILSIKNPFVTPNFCDQNFSQMHCFEDMIFLSPLEPLYLSSSL